MYSLGLLSHQGTESKCQYSSGPLRPPYFKEDEFLAAIEKGLDFVSHSEKLLTLGIKPNRPETGYGYIQIAEPAGDNFYKVKTFTEKPELELAKVFVESGEFYWNSGLFMWNVNSIIKASESLLPELTSKLAPGKEIYATDGEKAFIEENFPACPNVSIDFGIMEKADNVYVSLGDLAGLILEPGDHFMIYQTETKKVTSV